MKTLFAGTGSLLLGLALYSPTLAQTVDKKGLTLDGAKKVIAAAIAEAKSKSAPGGAIAVVAHRRAVQTPDEVFRRRNQ